MKYLLGTLLLLGMAGLLAFAKLFGFLAISQPLQANILVVEGWVSDPILHQAREEFQQHSYDKLVLASIRSPEEFRVSSNGGLLFSFPASDTNLFLPGQEVKVYAYSTPAEDQYAHFELLADGKQVGEATTGPTLQAYSFVLQDTARQFIVKFTNDRMVAGEDRNLYVHRLEIGSRTYPARSPRVCYDRGKIDGKQLERTDLLSQAEEAAERLLAQGILPEQLTVISAPEVAYDRTFTTAVAVKQWMQKHYPQYPSFNILTESVHARRSLMLYRKAFEGKAPMGIIAVPSIGFNAQNWWKTPEGRLYVTEQLLKYLYAKFLFRPS